MAIHSVRRTPPSPGYFRSSGGSPRTSARGPSTARTTSATDTADGSGPSRYPPSPPRWATTIPARRMRAMICLVNASGSSWRAAMASALSVPGWASASSRPARTA